MRPEKFLETAAEIFFPRKCPVCREIITPKGAKICPCCRKKIRFVKGNTCFLCGREVTDPYEEYCAECRKMPHAFSDGMALMVYDAAARVIRDDLRNRGKKDNADYLAAEMFLKFRKQILSMDPDVIIPVPMEDREKRVLGYCPAEVIAEKLGKYLDIPVDTHYLYRKKENRITRNMTLKERRKVLLKSFACTEAEKKTESVLLVNDLYRTGSTADGASSALIKAGVSQIHLLNAAITQRET